MFTQEQIAEQAKELGIFEGSRRIANQILGKQDYADLEALCGPKAALQMVVCPALSEFVKAANKVPKAEQMRILNDKFGDELFRQPQRAKEINTQLEANPSLQDKFLTLYQNNPAALTEALPKIFANPAAMNQIVNGIPAVPASTVLQNPVTAPVLPPSESETPIPPATPSRISTTAEPTTDKKPEKKMEKPTETGQEKPSLMDQIIQLAIDKEKKMLPGFEGFLERVDKYPALKSALESLGKDGNDEKAQRFVDELKIQLENDPDLFVTANNFIDKNQKNIGKIAREMANDPKAAFEKLHTATGLSKVGNWFRENVTWGGIGNWLGDLMDGLPGLLDIFKPILEMFGIKGLGTAVADKKSDTPAPAATAGAANTPAPGGTANAPAPTPGTQQVGAPASQTQDPDLRDAQKKFDIAQLQLKTEQTNLQVDELKKKRQDMESPNDKVASIVPHEEMQIASVRGPVQSRLGEIFDVMRVKSPGFYEEDKSPPQLGESYLVGKWDATTRADQNVLAANLMRNPDLDRLSAQQKSDPKVVSTMNIA